MRVKLLTARYDAATNEAQTYGQEIDVAKAEGERMIAAALALPASQPNRNQPAETATVEPPENMTKTPTAKTRKPRTKRTRQRRKQK